MTTSYKLFQGPSRKELLWAIDDKLTLRFRGRDEFGHSHLFEVFVTGIDLVDTGQDNGLWRARGIIVTKDGQRLNKSGGYRARYNSRRREGEFEEIVGPEEYSLEYFQRMDDAQLALEIKETRERIPKEIDELQAFTNDLGDHDRLVMLALHTHLLSEACVVPMVDCELDNILKKVNAERASRQARA